MTYFSLAWLAKSNLSTFKTPQTPAHLPDAVHDVSTTLKFLIAIKFLKTHCYNRGHQC